VNFESTDDLPLVPSSVTKVGRRMFPIIAVNIRGLDPDKMYSVELTFEQIDSHRWRYVSTQWQPGMKPDPYIHRIPYQHPDSPNYGRTWMKDPILFSKVKLTNKVDRASPSHVSERALQTLLSTNIRLQILLNSLHKYRPRIAIIDVMTKMKIYETEFVETEFIAVTAYQNEEVRQSLITPLSSSLMLLFR
jgi:brachyury protein